MRRFSSDKMHIGRIARDVFSQGCDKTELKLSIKLEDKIEKALGGYAEHVQRVRDMTTSAQLQAAQDGKITDAFQMALSLKDSAEMNSIDTQLGKQPCSLVLEQTEVEYLKKYFPLKLQDGRISGSGDPKQKRLIAECEELLDGGEEVEIDGDKVVPIRKAGKAGTG